MEIHAAEFTSCDVGDAPRLPELLDQIPPEQAIATVIAIAAQGAVAIIPPRKNAKPWKPDTAGVSRTLKSGRC